MASKLDDFGREVLDQTPVAVPFHFTRPEPIHLRLRRQILDVVEAQRHNGEVESLEDFNDFSIEGDPDSYDDGRSPYEEDELTGKIPMEEAYERHVAALERDERAVYEKLKAKYEAAAPGQEAQAAAHAAPGQPAQAAAEPPEAEKHSAPL